MTPLIVNTIAVILTLLVLSRVFGDNPLFKAAQYLFVGVSLGYAFVVVYFGVLLPAFAELVQNRGNGLALARLLTPFLLGLLLLPRLTNRQNFSWLANLPLSLLFGVGSALALGGALMGTLFPQLLDSARPFNSDIGQTIGNVVLAIGVILALSSFYFTLSPERALGRLVARGGVAGRWLIIFAFGFFFAGALLSYLTALNARLQFIVSWALGFF